MVIYNVHFLNVFPFILIFEEMTRWFEKNIIDIFGRRIPIQISSFWNKMIFLLFIEVFGFLLLYTNFTLNDYYKIIA